MEHQSRARARSADAVVSLPRRAPGERVDLQRLIPSARSLATAVLIVVGAGLAWYGARETSVFSVRTVEVAGAPPGVAAQVRRALAPMRGTSLLKVDLDESMRVVEALPTVAGARFDRAYPHTLRVVVTPERAVAVVRQGADAFLVAESGRVMARVERRGRPALARIWVKRDVELHPGASAEGDLQTAVAAVAPLRGDGFPGRVSSVTVTRESLTLRLRSGLEIRLGDAVDAQLKLAVAARVIPLLAADTLYLDVSVPERPVAGTLDSQVEPEGSALDHSLRYPLTMPTRSPYSGSESQCSRLPSSIRA